MNTTPPDQPNPSLHPVALIQIGARVVAILLLAALLTNGYSMATRGPKSETDPTGESARLRGTIMASISIAAFSLIAWRKD